MTSALMLTRRAGFWVRAAAAGLDAVIGGLPALLLAGFVANAIESDDPFDRRADYLLPAFFYTLFLAYSSFEVFAAATPGKMILRLVIAAPDGTKADRWTLALRWSTKNAALPFAIFHALTMQGLAGVAAGMMSWLVAVGCLQALDERKRTWHDEWARTAVYWRTRAGAADPPPAIAGPAPT